MPQPTALIARLIDEVPPDRLKALVLDLTTAQQEPEPVTPEMPAQVHVLDTKRTAAARKSAAPPAPATVAKPAKKRPFRLHTGGRRRKAVATVKPAAADNGANGERWQPQQSRRSVRRIGWGRRLSGIDGD